MLGQAVKLCGGGCFPPVLATVALCHPRKAPDSLTEEFPRVSRGEGRSQDRAQHDIQLEFLPLADELGAVQLREERSMSWSHVHAWSLSASPGTTGEAAAGSGAQGMRQRSVCLPPLRVASNLKSPISAIPTPRAAFTVPGHEHCRQPMKFCLG